MRNLLDENANPSAQQIQSILTIEEKTILNPLSTFLTINQNLIKEHYNNDVTQVLNTQKQQFKVLLLNDCYKCDTQLNSTDSESNPCQLECASAVVATIALFASVPSLFGASIGITSYVLTMVSLDLCLQENDMEVCWD